ncbi:MAG: flagellar protein [Selenomonadaceae bacterium]|nr:flagellar protein [Selenomonadaceae bacterium]
MTRLNIRNCARCKRIFIPVGNEKICPDCRAEDIELEERVKSYVRDHPGITVNQLIEGSGAPRNLVWRMIQQGQFENSSLKDAKYPCGNCGKIITRGTYCSECMAKLKENAQKFAVAMNKKRKAQEESNSNKTFSDSMYDALDSSRNR